MGQEWAGLLVLVAAFYAAAFWMVSARHPGVALACIFGLAPFQNDLSGIGGLHFSVSELHLLLSVPLLLVRPKANPWGWMSGVLGGALLITCLLALTAWRETTLLSLVQMFLYWGGAVAVCCHLPRRPQDLLLPWKALMGVGIFLACVAIATRSSYFLGLNKNGIGASLACALVIAVERWQVTVPEKRWLYLPVIGILTSALIMVLSRGAWIAAFSGITILFVWRAQYGRLLKLACAGVPLICTVWFFLPTESREYAIGFDESRYNIHARTINSDFARNQWLSSPVLGVGVGLRKEYDATNVFWLTLAESGPLGVLAFFTVHGWLFGGVWVRRKRWPHGSIQSSAVVLSGALLLGKLAHGMVDHYWSRGAIMIAWAAVGMALSVERMRVPDAETLRRNSKVLNGRIKRWPGHSHAILNT